MVLILRTVPSRSERATKSYVSKIPILMHPGKIQDDLYKYLHTS
jgi:hypothetical protein